MKYNIYLFDLDGTLTDSKEGILNSAVYALNAFNLPVPSEAEMVKLLGPPLHYSFNEYFGLKGADVELAVEKYREYYAVKGIFENKLYDGVVDMLKKLKGGGAVLGMATSKAKFYAEQIAERFNIGQYFDVISGSEMDGANGTKKEVITVALEKLLTAENTKTHEKKPHIVMIGDRKYDIIGARETGVNGIGVTWGYGTHEELADAGAAVIVNSPKELLDAVL